MQGGDNMISLEGNHQTAQSRLIRDLEPGTSSIPDQVNPNVTTTALFTPSAADFELRSFVAPPQSRKVQNTSTSLQLTSETISTIAATSRKEAPTTPNETSLIVTSIHTFRPFSSSQALTIIPVPLTTLDDLLIFKTAPLSTSFVLSTYSKISSTMLSQIASTISSRTSSVASTIRSISTSANPGVTVSAIWPSDGPSTRQYSTLTTASTAVTTTGTTRPVTITSDPSRVIAISTGDAVPQTLLTTALNASQPSRPNTSNSLGRSLSVLQPPTSPTRPTYKTTLSPESITIIPIRQSTIELTANFPILVANQPPSSTIIDGILIFPTMPLPTRDPYTSLSLYISTNALSTSIEYRKSLATPTPSMPQEKGSITGVSTIDTSLVTETRRKVPDTATMRPSPSLTFQGGAASYPNLGYGCGWIALVILILGAGGFV